jgi:uncharacterized membrane protein YcaP (DUF421 family)
MQDFWNKQNPATAFTPRITEGWGKTEAGISRPFPYHSPAMALMFLEVISMAAVLRAFLGYFFLVLVVRIVGRRPGKQMTPFEFVLIFFIGGLALTAIVGDEVSFTNGICQIITMGLAHYSLAWARTRSRRVARLVDGTPLILLENQSWRTDTLSHMRIHDDDVIASARNSGIKTLQEIDRAVLERNGEISVSRSQPNV